jgi:uncharacterized protein
MKKWLRLVVAATWCASAAWAVDWKALRPQGYVSDFAGVIDAASKAELERYSAAVEHATGVQMALVTISSLEGEPIEDVANTIARGWGVGQKGKNEGLLLLLAIRDHGTRLEIGYGLEPILPDGLAGSTLREMRPALRQEHFGEAFKAAAETLGNAIAAAKHVSLDSSLQRNIRPGTSDGFPWILVGGGVVLLLLLWRAGGPRRRGGLAGPSGGGFLPWMILGNSVGRSTWGGRGSGGFGGYDSGDGFAGFGGGDFGGGGASSDW